LGAPALAFLSPQVFEAGDTGNLRNVPVLLMTGYDQEELPVKYRSLPLLQKPLLRGELAEAPGRLFQF
jgi:hypothetical protein